MTREECREVLFSLANSINALRSAKVGNEGFSLTMSKEFALRLEEAIHSTFSIKEEQVLKALEDVKTEIAEYGSIWVGYTIKGHTDRDIQRTIEDVIKQAKTQVLELIDRKLAEVKGDKKW